MIDFHLLEDEEVREYHVTYLYREGEDVMRQWLPAKSVQHFRDKDGQLSVNPPSSRVKSR